jgi:serine/threonine-protein kinase
MVSEPPADGVDLGETQEYVPVPEQPPVPAAEDRPAAAPPAKKVSGPQRTSVLGDFRLIARLGEGGMGTVYRARQVSRPRDVALKVLSKQVAARPGFVERFHREGRLMARLDHPHVVRCYAVGESHGFHYLAMEFAGGGSIEAWLNKLGRFDIPDALHVVLACAKALAQVHGLGMIHRDVKPANMLLTSDGVVKLADLGLAKAADESLDLTRTGTGIGTPIYAAPEQSRDAKRVDARSDLYALGCVLYHLLAGRPPFEAKNLLDLILTKEKGTFTPICRHVSDAPAALDRVLTRMLARQPEQRYPDCDELIDDLSRLDLHGDRLGFLEHE